MDKQTSETTHDDPATGPDAMRWTPEPTNPTSIFGPVIDTYTRADALRDGVLIEADPALCREAGLLAPVALTAAAWADCVAWDDADNERKGTVQDETGRLWDVLYLTRFAVRRAGVHADRVPVELYRVPREGRARSARRTYLAAVAGLGDTGELVITVMLPDED
ncbi:hypothetical protein SRB5_53030 [Streptomyces sp. RB5]|uniref:Uncharacterized protein n=1 Tax=Streptomyces smaragdinus TaxID=2585196 RepID=A0A7K0CNR4_9ACTN|nr:DUF6573 family protein [Streptomyces smaragdinus]MQY15125.1 hypothetical protein [Streptomyces smaragdinus]